MTGDGRWAQVDALFEAALALPAGMRAAFLETQCDADPNCRAEVEELLRLATAPSALLQPATLAPELLRAALARGERQRRSDLAVDERVGVWRVLREIGHGGMGTVYLVERADGQFVQKGALKLVRGLGASEDIVRRLRRERRILASLTHANIARLLDGGQTADGRPYLVMEYVEGARIDQHCDARQLSVDRAARALPRGLRRDPALAPQPYRSSRYQALQHHRHRRRRGEAARLRYRPAADVGRRRP